VDHAVLYLVPVGSGRFELYSEPPADLPREDGGRLARWRARAMRLAMQTIGEHRGLWPLRSVDRVTLVHPAGMTAAEAESIRDRLLARATAHHVWWLAVSGVALVPAALLTLIPGPNVVAYYFVGRGAGHYFSWRGARRASAAAWDFRAEPALAELGGLADLPREQRASRVDAIAAHLRLPSLAAFFDRTAVPARS
jgi:K+-H+ exchange-related protein